MGATLHLPPADMTVTCKPQQAPNIFFSCLKHVWANSICFFTSSLSLSTRKVLPVKITQSYFLKDDKIFEYKNSWLKILDKKLFYLPYFNHPDPSVKRKSGFLTPSYGSSKKLGTSINIPYYKVISHDKDLISQSDNTFNLLESDRINLIDLYKY